MSSTDEIVKKGESLVASWLSATEALTQRLGAPPRLQETPGPLVLALNLTHLPIKNIVGDLKVASEETIKAHKGIRATIAIVKVLSPGFSSVSAEGETTAPKGKGAAKQQRGGGEMKEKLASVVGDDLRMHSYDLVNKKGVYQRSGRTATYARISPGMVFSLNVWGSKVVQTFKGQEEDIPPFSFVVVQLSMKGINSAAASSGHMLEIKSMQTSLGLSMAATRLLRHDAFPRSMQGSIAAQEMKPAAAAAGADADDNEQKQAGEDQALIKSNFASSVHFISTRPTTANGVFAVGPDGKLSFHISETLADLPAHAVHVRFDADTMGVSPGHEEWVAKFLNVAVMMGAVDLFVVMDNYRAKDIAPADLILDGFARIDVPTIIRHVLGAKASAIDPDADTFLTQSMPATSLKHVVIYQGLIPNLDLAIDIRFMTKKVGAVVVGSDEAQPAQQEPTTTMVHVDARWQRAHFVHFYLHHQPVLTVMLPSLASVGNAVERAKRALQPVTLVHTIEGACFEEEEEEAAVVPPPVPPKKKSKTSSS